MDVRENGVVLTNALVYIWKRLRDDRSVPMSKELVLSAESVTNTLVFKTGNLSISVNLGMALRAIIGASLFG